MRLFGLFALVAGVSWGCSCAAPITGNPPCQTAWSSDAVFTGVVVAVDDPGMVMIHPGEAPPSAANWPRKKITFRVSRALAGVPSGAKEVLVETGLGGGDCGYPFERGVEYIVYASNGNGRLATGICSQTRRIEKADEDLKYFDQLADAKPVSEVRVTAFDPHKSFGNVPGTGLAGVAGASIAVEGSGIRRSGTTDSGGRIVFADLPPGEYRVSATLSDYTMAHQIQPVRVHAKGCAEVPVALQLNRVITGHVTRDNGAPAIGVPVEAVPFRPRHEYELPFPVETAITDSSGRFEMKSLTAGEYYLGVSLTRRPPLEVPFTRWFYPGTEDPQSAVTVRILDRPGSQTFDLKLPPAQSPRQIEGVVLWPDGSPAAKAQILLEDPRWPWQVGTVDATTDNEGRFRVTVLNGTTYRVRAVSHTKGEPWTGDPVSIAPGTGPGNVSLTLTRTGFIQNRPGKELEAWRNGQGLR